MIDDGDKRNPIMGNLGAAKMTEGRMVKSV
jgi:hypothetical protein